MLRLVEVRLINWHSYQDETIHLDGTTLITGENGVGKTTLLDAIQYALVADRSRVRFNKASTGSTRELVDYCRWLVSAEDGGSSSRGKGTYLRGPCTTYVILGWRDDENRDRDFVCGVVIESGTSLDPQRAHFVIPGIMVGDVPAVNSEDIPNTISELRVLFRPNGWSLIPDARGYRKAIGQALAVLDDNFYQPLIKALDFKPLGSIRPFIMDFLLEERPIETGRLLRNVENYQKLEAEAQAAEQRAGSLREILKLHAGFETAEKKLHTAEYIVLRARVDEIAERLKGLREDLDNHNSEAEKQDKLAANLKGRLTDLRRDRDALNQRIAGVSSIQQRQELERDLHRVTEELNEIAEAERDIVRKRRLFQEALAHVSSPMAAEVRRRMPSTGGSKDPFGDEDLLGRCQSFLSNPEPDSRGQQAFNHALKDAFSFYLRAASDAKGLLRNAEEEYKDRLSEMKRLEQGHLRYRPELNALLHLLRTRLDYKGEIRPLCEFAEVDDPVWTDALEAMLGYDRFAIVLPPEYYKEARALYNRYKSGYEYPGSAGPVRLHSIKIIDMGGVLQERNRGAREGSLAEAIRTDNPLVRAYIDFRIGDVMKAHRLEDLNRHGRAVTAEVMVHQGHATYPMNPNAFADHYIGQAARVRRRERLQRELAELQQKISDLRPVIEHLDNAHRLTLEAYQGMPEYMTLSAKAQGRAAKEKRAEELREQIKLIDEDPEVAALNAELHRLEAEINETDEAERNAVGKHSSHLAQAKEAEKSIKAAEEQEVQMRALFSSRFSDEGPDVDQIDFERKYQEQRQKGLEPSRIERMYESRLDGLRRAVDEAKGKLREEQVQFNVKFGLAVPEDIHDSTPYRLDLERIEETRLPECRAKLAEAREEARRQLGEHYIYQLYDCFQYLKHAFDDINRALRAEEVRNNWGRYRFEANLIPRYKEVYELAYLVGGMGKDTLFSVENVGSSIIQELDRLTDSLLKSGSTEALDSALITDYRDFFDYDLVLEQKDGRIVRFANVSGGGSGGENQVPYYVAIFSAMYQMWRKHMPGRKPGCGLVMLDEAFSKMDEKNMDMVLDLARKFSLQLVLVTPGERVSAIAPRVETTLVIHRDNRSAEAIPAVRRFTRQQIKEALEADGTNQALAVALA